MSEMKAALNGIKVLDMSTVVLGPYAGQIMGDLGADVIRVEAPSADITRWSGWSPSQGYGPMFMACNRNKRSVALNLKHPTGKQAMIDLLKEADVFLHNVRQKAIDGLGLSYQEVKAIKPDIIYVHCVGYGSDGPYAGLPAYDDLIQGGSGTTTLRMNLGEDDAPELLPSLMADKTTGLHAAYATLAALFHKERTGEGQHVEVPMLESFTSFMLVEQMFGHVFNPPQEDYSYQKVMGANRRPYKTKDGWILIMPYSADQWITILNLADMGDAVDPAMLVDLPTMVQHMDVLMPAMAEAMSRRTSEDWFKDLQAADVAVMRVNRLHDLQEDPHLKATGFFDHRSHPTQGDWVATKHPVRFSKTPATTRREPPGLGGNSAEVMAEAGWSEEQIKQAMEAGALFTPEMLGMK